MIIYLIGSLRNPDVPKAGNYLRSLGHEVVDDWYAAGPEADDKWREYEIQRGRSYREALHGLHARHVFEFDFFHLNRSDAGVLLLPAGRSGHLEMGYLAGQGKPTWIVLGGNYDRWDVMYQFADDVFESIEELGGHLDNMGLSNKSITCSSAGEGMVRSTQDVRGGSVADALRVI